MARPITDKHGRYYFAQEPRRPTRAPRMDISTPRRAPMTPTHDKKLSADVLPNILVEPPTDIAPRSAPTTTVATSNSADGASKPMTATSAIEGTMAAFQSAQHQTPSMRRLSDTTHRHRNEAPPSLEPKWTALWSRRWTQDCRTLQEQGLPLPPRRLAVATPHRQQPLAMRWLALRRQLVARYPCAPRRAAQHHRLRTNASAPTPAL